MKTSQNQYVRIGQQAAQSRRTYARLTQSIKRRQAKNMLAAAKFAVKIDAPLGCHVTIHWALTALGNDPTGAIFEQLRGRLRKALKRLDIRFVAVWARERQTELSDSEHAHMVFHLPNDWQVGKRRREIVDILERLIERLTGGIIHEGAFKLTFHTNNDVRYLLKGGTPKVWREHRIKLAWRTPQGLIVGKRCGSTENIGVAARKRWQEKQVANV